MMQSDTARIFDIRRFSTHDGSGIRTTVFFKGCPMRCAWCHNPEGIDPFPHPVWFQAKCIGCGSCTDAAKNGGIRLSDGRILLNTEADEDWDAVMDECPASALRWDSREISLTSLMAEIRKDLPFYAHGGGGVTLSGGDPLMQADFASRLLRQCRAEGIHTAIETELWASWEKAFSVLEHCDLIYADLKLMDENLHRRYTGAGNRIILENFRRLLLSPFRGRVIVRTPMIPGITATQENIAAIARFLAGLYADVHLELLNYNPLAQAKYALVDKEYCFAENPPRFSPEEMGVFCKTAMENGIKNIIKGE